MPVVVRADQLRRIRENQMLNFRELGEAAGVNPRHLSRLERGLRDRVSGSTVRKIATALDVHPSEIAEVSLVD